MDNKLEIKPIAYIYTAFPEKFGVPRQSGIVSDLVGRIVFEPEFRDRNALREIEQYSHLWLIWGFSENRREEEERRWSPTVRPPRLGGNTRVGVFASRSPFRPNPLGLSVVKLEKVEPCSSEGPIIFVSGVDMVDRTPIYDIKPYLNYVDSIPEATDGFALAEKDDQLEVVVSEEVKNEWSKIVPEIRETLTRVLAQDPRPQYQEDANRTYTMGFDRYEICFTVKDVVLTIKEVKRK